MGFMPSSPDEYDIKADLKLEYAQVFEWIVFFVCLLLLFHYSEEFVHGNIKLSELLK